MKRLRERILADFLAPLVPGHVRVAHSGEILAVTEDTSPQCDVVLYDPRTPPLLDTQASRIFTGESVYGPIKVKTMLDKDQLIDTCEKIRKVKVLPKPACFPRLMEQAYDIHGMEYSYFPTLGVIFAFAGGDLIALRTTSPSGELDVRLRRSRTAFGSWGRAGERGPDLGRRLRSEAPA